MALVSLAAAEDHEAIMSVNRNHSRCMPPEGPRVQYVLQGRKFSVYTYDEQDYLHIWSQI